MVTRYAGYGRGYFVTLERRQWGAARKGGADFDLLTLRHTRRSITSIGKARDMYPRANAR
jgi:hypothetical protein